MLPSCGIRAGLVWAVWQLSCGIDGPEFKSQYEKKRRFFFPQGPNRLWVPPSLLFNWCRCSFLEVMLQSREVNHSPPFGAEIQNEWSYTSIAPIWRRGVDRLWCTNLKIRATIAKRQLIMENFSATSYHHGLKSFLKDDSRVSSTGHEKQRFTIMSKSKPMDNVLKQKYLIHAITSDLFKVSFNTSPPMTHRSLKRCLQLRHVQQPLPNDVLENKRLKNGWKVLATCWKLYTWADKSGRLLNRVCAALSKYLMPKNVF
jgi:hypothetical protein